MVYGSKNPFVDFLPVIQSFLITTNVCQKEEAFKTWGRPETFDEFKSIFAKFCLGKIPALPWSEQGLSAETTAITHLLAKINELGFLTINSQPAVNGVPSDDKTYGWGPSNGFVYQKVKSEPYHLLLLINKAQSTILLL
jgi:hypothetical protein